MAALHEGSHGLFWRGEGTFKVPAALHRANRAQALRRLRELCGAGDGIVFVRGGRDRGRHSTDHEHLFRQESFFHYLFGVEESECFGVVDVATGKATLFVPKLPEEHAVWLGNIPTLEVFKDKYGVDEVCFEDAMEAEIQRMKPARVHVLSGRNTDSNLEIVPPQLPGAAELAAETAFLHRALCESRSIKTELEVEAMRYVSRVSSDAHVAAMRMCKPGAMEYQLESTFLHHAYFHGGCRFSSYTSIVGSGEHGAFLHYGHSGAPNAGQIKEGDLVLCDMGAEYHGYAADITCTYPASGRFTPDQAAVYNAVLDAHQSVLSTLKPGVSWPEMHALAEKKILTGLLAAGFLQGDVQEMLADNLGATFMPHGMGHLLGIDTHDVGGYGEGFPERPSRAGANRLRTARVMEENMMVTVEPGCYFSAYLLDKAFDDPALSKYLNKDKISANLKMGGVRLEDNVLITKDGCESFTKVPRTVNEIEAVMAGAEWTR
mmetsp:Transcript_15472/g.39418  ORF Transcript_15472/g.39418 Transcript_15472/m.39418 type:complete len:490 (+) Transcript_15472:22-1491(+)|eukprot:CAMPEP_0198243452 /NCGR_PEP_ID=MMETSP1446-20131203/27867_1 /TAXON_ID=1461542 ORGANISM="Unidentified sp, Strain CCMP2111" /NCGR_SAMPLE_ID=MMETSP1446 /ASSEMBLY_ACC=CAM_ASM_001112 /LENGTH=489 /DNA_ID=CAMNT_0043927269 /DNA_START=15 /DNA_END=1484 /DNA_ORIENTATION=-